MDPATQIPPPVSLEGATGPAGAQSVEAFTAILESMVARVEAACQGRGSRKRPPPTPILSDSSDSDSEMVAAVAGPSARAVTSGKAPSDSEEDVSSPVIIQEEALVDALVVAVQETLKLEVLPAEATETEIPFGTNKPIKTVKVFPVPKCFGNKIKGEWEHSKRTFTISKRIARRYPFEESIIKKWTVPPVVDPPISRLNKATVIPVEDTSSLKDPVDRKMEAESRTIFSLIGSAFRPVIVIGLVSQTLTEWAKMVSQDLKGKDIPQETSDWMEQIIQGLQFICDAALDTTPLLGHASMSAVILRRVLWLKCWSADLGSKKTLTNLPFQGNRLFGATLDEIIKDATGGKSTFLPQAAKVKGPRNKRGPFFTAHKGRQAGTSGKGKTPPGGFKKGWSDKQRTNSAKPEAKEYTA